MRLCEGGGFCCQAPEVQGSGGALMRLCEGGGFCCQAPPGPALRCEAQGLWFVSSYRSRGNGDTRIVVVGNYAYGPMTVVPCRAKADPLRPRRSCFAPARPRRAGVGWRRRALPPGPNGLLRSPFIAISGPKAGTANIGGPGLVRNLCARLVRGRRSARSRPDGGRTSAWAAHSRTGPPGQAVAPAFRPARRSRPAAKGPPAAD